jgi:hypothetical protein
MKPHKHAELIKQWAEGVEIEVKHPSNGSWWDAKPPVWDLDYEYRIKPEHKPDVVVYSRVVGKFMLTSEGIEIQQLIVCALKDRPNIKYTFDGEWGKLKSAEVL